MTAMAGRFVSSPSDALARICTSRHSGDSVYRNLGGQDGGVVQFQAVTDSSRVVERQFGQGICIADINGDGLMMCTLPIWVRINCGSISATVPFKMELTFPERSCALLDGECIGRRP